MTSLTPAEIEAIIKETLKVTGQNSAWREAIVTVMKTPNLPTITKAASSVNMSVSSFIRHFNVACWKADEIIRPLLKDAKIFTTDQIDDFVIQGRILYRSGIPDAMRAGGAGGAGAAATGAAAGKGAIILKGLAILGGLIVFAVVSYYVAGYAGELLADDPIERTWKGDPEARAAWEAEQAAHVVTYGDMRATIDGIDVTDDRLVEPKYLYYDTRYPRYYLEHTPIMKPSENITVDGREVRSAKYTLGIELKDKHAIGGPYYTYGEICEAFAKKRDYPEWETFVYKYYYGDKSFEVVDCGRERL
jgi:hypothetical protein